MNHNPAAKGQNSHVRTGFPTETGALEQVCAAYLDACGDVWIDKEALARLARAIVAPARSFDWSRVLRPAALTQNPLDLGARLHDLAAFAGQESGCVQELSSPPGKAQVWTVDGCPSEAVTQMMTRLRNAGAMPGENSPGASYRAMIRPLLGAAPWPERRTRMLEELSGPQATAEIRRIAGLAGYSDGVRHFPLAMVAGLVDSFPLNFGDPLGKKATLAVIMLAEQLRDEGRESRADIPVAADYLVPETLHLAGALRFSDDLCDRLDSGAFVAEDDPALMAARAASIMIGNRLAALSGMAMIDVDSALWHARASGFADQLAADSRARGLRVAQQHFWCESFYF